MGFSSKDWSAAHQTPDFQPYQIVCLEYEETCLYAEVVQVVAARQVCWVRPLLLAIDWLHKLSPETENADQPCWYDLRQGSDLLLPLVLFRPALDTEVLPLFSKLYTSEDTLESGNSDRDGHQKLHQFVRQICQARPEVFR
jgi:hypothetical protein